MGLMKLLFGAKAASAASKVKKASRVVRPVPPSVSSGPMRLAGSGDIDQSVVGEAFYQTGLDAICGGKCEDGHEKSCRAQLIPEPTNRHDKNAVAISIAGKTVGYLPGEDARTFHRDMKRLGAAGSTAECRAVITGGWIRPQKGKPSDEGHYGVSLDLEWPLTQA